MTNDRAQHLAELPKLVHPNFRVRFTGLLETKKGRQKLCAALAHDFHSDPRTEVRIKSGQGESDTIYRELVRLGAPETCYVMSENSAMDDRFLDLRSLIFGDLIGGGIGMLLSCIPGRLGYYNGEDAADRYIIHVPK